MDFKNKNILITAGPTWVAIDNVRVISNIASGRTGCLLADKLSGLGASVTLLLGAGEEKPFSKKVKVIRFKFFDELRDILIKQLKSKKFSTVIHSAAVSDYKPAMINKGKVSSGKSVWNVKFIPTEKLINKVKKIDQKIKLIGFKFELGLTDKKLINQANSLIKRSGADLVVANTQDKSSYKAYLVEKCSVSEAILNKNKLINQLIKKI